MSFILGLIFFSSWIWIGIWIHRKIYGKLTLSHTLLASLCGTYLGSWITYLLCLFWSYLGKELPATYGILTSFNLSTALAVFSLFVERKNLKFLKPIPDTFYFYFYPALLFTVWMMFSSFGYRSNTHQLLVDTLVLSDFGHHIPLVRSFSMGENIPAQAPLFAGEKIRYHFLFYLMVGALEQIGMRIDWAMNLLSVLGFLGMLASLSFLIDSLFPEAKNKLKVGLTILLTLTSSSFAFTKVFSEHGLNALFRKNFLSGGPYYNWNQVLTGLFWTLAIFTNQRHFAFGIALGLFALGLMIKYPKRSTYILVALILGGLPYFHGIVFLSTLFVLSCYFFFQPNKKECLAMLMAALVIALPQLISVSKTSAEAAPHRWLGYGLGRDQGWVDFFVFWTQNLGLKFLLLPLLIFLVKGSIRKILISSLILFLFPNVIQMGIDVWTNHKFFNIWILFLNIGFAVAIAELWNRKKVYRWIALFFLPLLTLSGVLDLSPLFRADTVPIYDWQTNNTSQFVLNHIPPREPVATSYQTYHPVSLVGRPVLLGWPYFSWSAGFDTKTRTNELTTLYETKQLKVRCTLLRKFHTRYLIAGKEDKNSEPYHPDLELLIKENPPIYENSEHLIFDYGPVCKIKSRSSLIH